MDANRFDGLTRGVAGSMTRASFARMLLGLALGLPVALRAKRAAAQGWCAPSNGPCAWAAPCCEGGCRYTPGAWVGTCDPSLGTTAAVTTDERADTNEDGGDGNDDGSDGTAQRSRRRDRGDSRGNGQWHETDRGNGGRQGPFQRGDGRKLGRRGRRRRDRWEKRQLERRRRRDRL